MPVIGTGVEICTSTTRPNNPVVGTIIYETDTASYRWCTSLGPVVWTGMIPVGTVQSFAGTTEPPGWLFCFGQSLNATSNPQYADLWGMLGTTYGGSGVTAFNLPDLRGRAVFGKDDMGGSAANRVTSAASGITGTSLNSSGGTQTHTLTTAQLPAHGHSFSVTGTVDGGAAANFGSHYTVGARTSFSGTTSNAGSDNAHQNMPPTIILNYIIKF